MRLRMMTVALVVGLALTCGCRRQDTRPAEYQTLAQDPNRDTQTARQQNGRALEAMEKGDLDEAEKTLKAALAADLFYGPAHNNLGVVYHRQKKHYLAAWEFQYAARLMPHSPEPRNNLGMVYESVGRLEEAEKWYDTALSLEPDNPELIGNLTRLRVRAGRADEKTYGLLQDLALKDTRPEWARWARDRMALMRRPEAIPPVEESAPSGDKPPAVPAGPSPSTTDERPGPSPHPLPDHE